MRRAAPATTAAAATVVALGVFTVWTVLTATGHVAGADSATFDLIRLDPGKRVAARRDHVRTTHR